MLMRKLIVYVNKPFFLVASVIYLFDTHQTPTTTRDDSK